MSGSGSGAFIGGGGGGGFGGQPVECDEIQFKTNLASPVEEVVERLEIGAELHLTLEFDGIQRVVAQFEDDDVGSIIEGLDDLIRCLQLGATFRAEVIAIDDGIVRVEVQPV